MLLHMSPALPHTKQYMYYLLLYISHFYPQIEYRIEYKTKNLEQNVF